MSEKVKLAGGPEKTVTWVWLDLETHGQLKVEYYDFSELAHRTFGTDIAYVLTVKEMIKLFSLTKHSEATLLDWTTETFKSYFEIKSWLEKNDIGFLVEIESWA